MLVFGGGRVGRAGITPSSPTHHVEIQKLDNGIVQVFMGLKAFHKRGVEWVDYLQRVDGGYVIDPWAQAMLESHGFDSGSDMLPDIVIIPCELIPPNKRTMDKIHLLATREYGATMMNHGTACMLRSVLQPVSLKGLGFTKVVCAHQPISVYAGVETPDEAVNRVLTVSCVGRFGFEGLPYVPTPWGGDRGIAFASIEPFPRPAV
jgi:hypothetical protein